MKITDINLAVLDANWGPWIREWILVRIDTDEGISGLGECAGPADRVSPYLRAYKELLCGADPIRVEYLFRSLVSRAYAGFTASHFDSGLAVHAAAGIETALLDISGKASGLPVCNLIGGRQRDTVRLYACVGGLDTYRDMAHVYEELGISILKFDTSPIAAMHIPGGVTGSHLTRKGLKYLQELVVEIRGEAKDAEIALEGRCGTLTNAMRFMGAIEDQDLAWVEDLLPATNPGCWATVTAASRTPTLTGEGLHMRHEFHEYLQRNATRIVAPDFQVCGGITEGKKIAEMADLYHLLVAPHNASSAIGIAAAVHACAAIPNLLALEFHAMPAWDRILRDSGLHIQDGCMAIPEEPGLGIQLDEFEAKKYARGEAGLFVQL